GRAERHREAEQHPQHADDGHGAERHHHHVGRALDRHHAAIEEREPGDHHRETDDATQHECCGSCIHVHLLEWCGSGESRSLPVTDVSVTWTGSRCCLHVKSCSPVTVRAMKFARPWWVAIAVAVVVAVALVLSYTVFDRPSEECRPVKDLLDFNHAQAEHIAS